MPSFLSHFTSGLLAECVSCVLWVPIDVVKERLQVQANILEAAAAKAAAQAATSTATTTATAATMHGAAAGTAVPSGVLYQGNIDAIRKIWAKEGEQCCRRCYTQSSVMILS